MTTTSSTAWRGEGKAHTRDRLEKLVQITSHVYAMRLSFGQKDGVEADRIVIGVPDTAPEAEYRSWKGRALHLLGHRLSDPRPAVARAQARQQAGARLFVRLWHALEDARQENRMVMRWPGMERSFAARLAPGLGGTLLRRMPVERQLLVGLYLEGRGLHSAEFAPEVRQALDDVAAEIQRGATGQNPLDSIAALEAIYPRLVRLLGRPSAHADRGEPGLWETEAAEREEASGTDRPSLPSVSPEFVSEDGRVWIRPSGHPRSLPEWYRPGSAPWFETNLGEKKVHPEAQCSDRQTVVIAPRGEAEAFRTLWAEVQEESGLLLARWMRVLQEAKYLRYAGRYRSGKLENPRLWKQRLGNYRLFQRREVGDRREVAFSLLVDESASMEGRGKSRIAAKAAILLGEALSLLDIPLEIIGFTTAGFEAREAMRLGLTPAHEFRTTRCSRLEHRVYKSFAEPYRPVRHRLAGIQPRHNNWDEEHLLFAFRRIQSRPESSKVILVVSDGQPNGSADHLVAAAAAVERQGCTVIGIGIGEDHVLRIYRNALVVSDFRQLGEALLGILARETGGGIPAALRSRAHVRGGAMLPW